MKTELTCCIDFRSVDGVISEFSVDGETVEHIAAALGIIVGGFGSELMKKDAGAGMAAMEYLKNIIEKIEQGAQNE